MKELQIEHKPDLPANLLQRFWIEPGAPFDEFLQRFKEHDLFFTVEVPNEDDDRNAMVNVIEEKVHSIHMGGGPELPTRQGDLAQHERRHWEFLSCKKVKSNVQHLRARSNRGSGSTEKRQFVEISSSTKMLAPVDYNSATITKQLGFKNTLRMNRGDPDKFVVIGA
jgi:hypothetical protein